MTIRTTKNWVKNETTKLSLLRQILPLSALMAVSWLGLSACAALPKVDNLTWHSCRDRAYERWFDDGDNIPKKLECTIVTVPMDYKDKNNSKTVQIAMTRLVPKQPKGAVLFISGGPGQHSLHDGAALMDTDNKNNTALLTNFTIYGFAQRGIAPSYPEIVCDKRDDIETKDFVDACLAHTDNDFLKNISSESVVHDLDNIRTQLGLDKMAMIGWSYGTKLVSRYAELYGDHLSAGVLDGVVDTTEDMFTMLAGQEKGYDDAIKAYFKACQSRDGCPFVNKDDYKAEFHKTLLEIDELGLVDKKDNEISADDVLSLFYEQLMWSEYWADGDRLIDELLNHDTTLYNELMYDYEDKAGMYEDMAVINCADGNIKMDKDSYIKRMREIDALSDYDNYEPRDDDDYLNTCYYWQNIALGTDSLTPPKPKDGTPKLLFVAQTGDPATPYKNAVAMMNYFDGELLTIHGNGHTISFSDSSDCVDKAVVSYLLNPNDIASATCPAN